MKRVLFYALIAVIAGGSLAAEPTWAQKRGSDEGGQSEKSGDKRDKKGGDKRDKKGGKKGDKKGGKKSSKHSKKDKSDSPLQQLAQAMHQELNLSDEQSAQVRKIFSEYHSSGQQGDREASKSDRQEMESRLGELQEAAKKANKDGDRERARELMKERHELMRSSKDSAGEAALDPKMFDDIAEMLNEEQRPKFWRIVERLSAKEKGEPGVQYLEFLQGLDLTNEQNAAVARVYENFLDDLQDIDKSDHKAVKELHKEFQAGVMESLTDQQQAAFEQAVKKSRSKSRSGGKSGGKNRGGGKGGKGDKGQKGEKGAKVKSIDR